MTLSVKPFGCMPSAGVSDGVQSAITEKFPGTIFCPVETSGDGRVNFYSRVQMYLFKAKKAAIAEYDRACAENGVTREEVKAFLEAAPQFASSLHKAPHRYSGNCADLVAEIAPHITLGRGQRIKDRLSESATKTAKVLEASPQALLTLVRGAVEAAPTVASRVKEDILILRETRQAAKAKKVAAGRAAASDSVA
jgi:hypothetical protein